MEHTAKRMREAYKLWLESLDQLLDSLVAINKQLEDINKNRLFKRITDDDEEDGDDDGSV